MFWPGPGLLLRKRAGVCNGLVTVCAMTATTPEQRAASCEKQDERISLPRMQAEAIAQAKESSLLQHEMTGPIARRKQVGFEEKCMRKDTADTHLSVPVVMSFGCCWLYTYAGQDHNPASTGQEHSSTAGDGQERSSTAVFNLSESSNLTTMRPGACSLP